MPYAKGKVKPYKNKTKAAKAPAAKAGKPVMAKKDKKKK